MALTIFNPANVLQGDEFDPFTEYYELDRLAVINQSTGVISTGLILYNFRNEGPIAVFAAKDAGGEIFPKVALPCPPWYHVERPESFPLNILNDI